MCDVCTLDLLLVLQNIPNQLLTPIMKSFHLSASNMLYTRIRIHFLSNIFRIITFYVVQQDRVISKFIVPLGHSSKILDELFGCNICYFSRSDFLSRGFFAKYFEKVVKHEDMVKQLYLMLINLG